MKMRRPLTGLLAAMLLLSACTGEDATPDADDGPEVVDSDDDDETDTDTDTDIDDDQDTDGDATDDGELPSADIATVLTRSGFAAVFGENQQRGIELAVEHLREEGVADLTLVASEDAGDSNTTAVNAYRRVAGQDPVAIMGPIVGTMVLAMRPDLESDGIPLITTAATRSLTLEDNTMVYRNFPHSGMSASANALYAFDELGIERPAILADNTAFGQDDAAVLVEEAEGRGLEIVANETVDPEALDVTGQVSRILNADADAVFVQLLTGSPLAEAIRSLRGAGFDGLIFAAPGLTSPSTLELLSDADVEGAYSPGLSLDRDDPEVQAFIEAFEDAYGDSPDIYAAVMYDTVRMLGAVVADGASTAEEVRAGLDSVNYEGLTAPLQADEEGNLAHRVTVLQFDDAKSTSVIETFDLEFTPRDG